MLDIVLVTTEIMVIFRYFIIVFNVDLKTKNYTSKTEYL